MILSQNQTAAFLSNLGYAVNSSYKFRIRQDDNTPSASIDKNGKIKDFGSGWYGDIIDFLITFENYDKKQAFSYAKEFSGQDFQNVDFTKLSTTKKSSNTTILKYEKEEAEQKIAQIMQSKNKNQARFNELLSQTILIQGGLKENLQNLLGYNDSNDRLIMPIYNRNNEVVNFWSYNPNYKVCKVLFEKNRPREIFNINLLNNTKQNEMIYIFEGEKDALNALNLGIKAIAMPSASFKIQEHNLPLFKNKNFCIIFDCDESGRNGALSIKNQLNDIANNVIVYNLAQDATNLGIKNIKKGYDFTDYVFDKYFLQQKIKNFQKL